MTDLNNKQRSTTQFSSAKHLGGKLFYFLAGGGVGAIVALLFAPKSGAELRTEISDLTKKGYEETIDFAQQIKEQSAEVYDSVKEKSGKVYDLIADKWTHFSDTVNELPDQIINGEIKPSEDKKKSTGRRSSAMF